MFCRSGFILMLMLHLGFLRCRCIYNYFFILLQLISFTELELSWTTAGSANNYDCKHNCIL